MENCNREMYHRPLAMAQVEWQSFRKVMDGRQGLAHGTIFEELVLPFYGAKAACNPQFMGERRCDCR